MMRRSISLRGVSAALTLTTMLGGIATEALAQIEEIVVTTRKREENLQEVPIVIQAFTSEAIQRKGINDLADVAKLTSGVMLDTGFSKQDTRVVIRGLSPTRGRQNVAILQDEVDISSLAQASAGGSFTINPRLLDVERIEVVKGPHPALFGRSAFSGAINYISKKPGDEFQGNAQIDLATDAKAEGRISMSGPVVADKLSIGFNGSLWNFGGFYDSLVTGHGVGGGDGWGTAFSAKFTPNDNLTVNLRSEYSKDYFDPDARFFLQPIEVAVPQSAITKGVLAATTAGNTISNSTYPQAVGSLGNASDYPASPSPSRNPRTGEDYPGTDRKIFRTTMRMDWENEDVKLSSITHYGDNNTFQFNDTLQLGDYNSSSINSAQENYIDTDTRLITQEFRIQSTYESPFQWTAGGLFWNEKLTQLSRNTVCVSTSGGGTALNCYSILGALNSFQVDANNTTRQDPNITKRDTHHYSGYFLGEYNITDQWSVDAEVRYTVEKEDTAGFATTAPSILGCPTVGAGPQRVRNANGTLSCLSTANQVAPQNGTLLTVAGDTRVEVGSVFWAPRFAMDYKIDADSMVYASVGMGKKPGGLSTIQNALGTATTNIYDPEQMWVYELGSKNTWLDGKLQANGAIYYQDYSKKQVSITQEVPLTVNPLGVLTRVVNAAKASVKGLELDLLAQPTEMLTLRASYTYNDGEYKDFKDISNTISVISRANVRSGDSCANTVSTTVGTTTTVRCVVDYSGYRLEGASRHSLQGGFSLQGDISADLSWFTDTDIRYQSKRYTSFENSLYMDPYWLVDLRAGVKTDTWNLTAYVNNLFNDDTIKATAVYLQAWNVSYQAPRPTTLLSLASGTLPDKRQFGLRASVNF
ncbi:MAG: TonB-dependent receptor [Rhodospirillaceae bacterium]|nr:TonB-dependent receptor [Rhodospirillaceae bacterium]